MHQQELRTSVPTRLRVLLVAEAVTLAHVARPVALGMALDIARYDVCFACDPRYSHFVANPQWTQRPLHSISSQHFLQALAQGRPLYNVDTLRAYVNADLRLIEEFKPDLIVGDFRLSLSVSARRAGIPYVTISNAYWSPYSVRRRFPLPVLPMTGFMPIPVAKTLFSLVRPAAFAYHAMPLNRIRREYGLPSLGPDLRHIYTDADHTLYADIPELFPTIGLPTTHHYLGPVLWSPPVPKPAWWDDLPKERPIVYVTLGSSGMVELLPALLEALCALPLTVIAATAGAGMKTGYPANVYWAEYLPGMEAAARANLVICNAGSLTSQQALAASVPVLGVASNMDQFLNMEAVVNFGAGVLIRADRMSVAGIRTIVSHLLATPEYAHAAAKLAHIFAQYSAPDRFAAIVAELLGETTTQSGSEAASHSPAP